MPLVLLVVVGLVAFVAWPTERRSRVPASPSLHGAFDRGPERFEYEERLLERPPPSPEQAPAPLGQPGPLARTSDVFGFMFVQPGSTRPVAYDPCRPIHIVVNGRTAPPGADQALRDAVEAVHRATGLVFVFDGPTDEAPNPERPAYQPDRYGSRWAPVLVAWSDETESPMLADGVTGSGGSIALSVEVGRVYVTGSVTLDGPQLGEMLRRRGGQAAGRAVIMHELGHLVGLNHVPDPSQLMNPEQVRGRVSFGDGDLAGLAQLGTGDCFPTV